MAETTSKIVLDLDNKEFVKKLKESLGLMGELGKGGGIEDLGSMFIKVGTTIGLTAAAVGAFKVALDLTKEGERVKQLDNSFEALAQSVGIAGDQLKEKLVGSAKGLADDTDLINAANRAIVSMGKSAEHLPEVMEIARKATALFGGDLVTNFENLNHALASGNTRALKQMGIVLDTDKAYKEYAKSIGVSVKYLDDQGKKQAILNAFLEQGKSKFAGVDESSLKLTNTIKRLSVLWGQMVEAAARFVEQSPGTKAAIDAVANAVDFWGQKIKKFTGTDSEQAKGRIEDLTEELYQHDEEIRKVQASLDQATKFNDTVLAASYKKRLEAMQAERAQIMQNLDGEEMYTQSIQKQAAAKESLAAGAGAGEDDKKKSGGIDTTQLTADRKKFYADVRQLEQENLVAMQANATSEEAIVALHEQQKQAVWEEFAAKKQQMDQQAKDLGIVGTEQHNEALINLEIQKNEKLTQLDNELDQKKMMARENQLRHAQSTNEKFVAGFRLAADQQAKALNDAGNKGQKTFGLLKNSAKQAFIDMGSGAKSGSEAIKSFFLGALADMAEMQGEALLAKGMSSMGGPQDLAAGAALLALSGAIRAMAGSGGGGAGGGGGGGGGGAAATGADLAGGGGTEAMKPTKEEQQKKAVTVAIQGNYFETDQTRTRLMEMIRESGDYTDFNLKQIGQK